MKRIASLIICALVVLTSCVLFAVPASAAEKVVYVKNDATGDGSSASSPIGTLDAALKLLAETGGTVKIVDEVTVAANTLATAQVPEYYVEPAHDRQITITSADSANKAKLVFDFECTWYALSGPTVFENLKLVNNTFDQPIRLLARGNHITMGEGLEMYLCDTLQTPEDPLTLAGSMKGFAVIGLTNIGAEYDGYMEDDCWITIKSGVYYLIQAYTRGFNTEGELTGNAYLEFLGDFATYQIGFGPLTKGYTATGESFVYWDAVVTGYRVFMGYDAAILPFTTNLFIAGGNLVDAAGLNRPNTGGQGFCGNTKVKTVNLWYDETNTAATDFANFIMGTYAVSFNDPDAGLFGDELKNYNGPAYRLTEDVKPLDDAPVTDAPATEAPATDAPVTELPATDAPVVDTTAAPEIPEDTPATGDASVMVVFVAAAVLSVAAVVVIKKKEN